MTCANSISPDAFCTSGTSPTFATHGPLGAPAILVLGGISARPDLSWWSALVGPGLPIDTERFLVISTDWKTDEDATTHTQAQWILAILDRLGIDRLHAAIGCSYGGMVALALSELAPERVGELIVLGAAHRPHPMATAWRWLQRQLVSTTDGQEGLALARALAMTTYRSDRELDARFADDPDALISWLEHHGEQFTQRFVASEFATLSAAIDRHRVQPSKISTPTTVIGFDSDLLAPPWLLDELVDALPTAQRFEIDTHYGHDGFLKETDSIGWILAKRLSAAVEVAA